MLAAPHTEHVHRTVAQPLGPQLLWSKHSSRQLWAGARQSATAASLWQPRNKDPKGSALGGRVASGAAGGGVSAASSCTMAPLRRSEVSRIEDNVRVGEEDNPSSEDAGAVL